MTTITPEKIKKFRETFQLSQRELAHELGISKENVKNWEYSRAKPPPYLSFALEAIAQKYSNRKAPASTAPRCPHCGEEYLLKQTGRKWSVNHSCPDGFRHTAPPRSLEELSRMLSITISTQQRIECTKL